MHSSTCRRRCCGPPPWTPATIHGGGGELRAFSALGVLLDCFAASSSEGSSELQLAISSVTPPGRKLPPVCTSLIKSQTATWLPYKIRRLSASRPRCHRCGVSWVTFHILGKGVRIHNNDNSGNVSPLHFWPRGPKPEASIPGPVTI